MVSERRGWLTPRVGWAALAVLVAVIPFARGLTGARIFFLRDLSMHFWYRFLWFRRTVLAGNLPLWDPYTGGGQSAVADAMHQMFLLPSVLVRFIGSEGLAFNLWVLVPFPIGALGTWAFLARRYSAPAAALGAIAFAVSGPVVSTGNFPNMSWSVAAIPWVLWAADRVMETVTPRRVAVLALTVACQVLAGEPVTMVMTVAIVAVYSLIVPAAASASERARRLAAVAAGLALGLLLSAVQLIPMRHAVALSARTLADTQIADFWSLHPLMLAETVSPMLAGDYITSLTIESLPWMPLLNSGREPFFYSLYFGAPLIALAVCGLCSSRDRRWSVFWTMSGLAALVCASGGYTPIYPFFRDHLPVLGFFRFPAKYLVAASMTLAAGAAAGWDLLATAARSSLDEASKRTSRVVATTVVLAIGAVAYVLAGLCLYFPNFAARRFYNLARALPMPATPPARPHPDPVDAAAYMLHALPHAATAVLLLALLSAALIWFGALARPEAKFARAALYALIVGDLLIRALPINPVMDRSYLEEPEWVSYTRADPDARFYLGGKQLGFIDIHDPDGPRALVGRKGFNGAENRAASNPQMLFYPSAWQMREILSQDLPVLWPKEFDLAGDLFFNRGRDARDRFLERAGVRYRVLSDRAADGHTPLVKIPFLLGSSLYDWGPMTPRVSVVSSEKVVGDANAQVRMLFDDGWDSGRTAIVDHVAPAAGADGEPQEATARITASVPDHLTVEASAPANGGYLLVLDSYSPDWQVTIDGTRASLLRADGLFRGVHLAPGTHTADFRYRPIALVQGAAVSGIALLLCVGLVYWPERVER